MNIITPVNKFFISDKFRINIIRYIKWNKLVFVESNLTIH